MMNSKTLSRRQFLTHSVRGSAAVLAGLPVAAWGHANKPATPRPKVAAIYTIFRFRSHAYNILENFFEPYLFNGKLIDPTVPLPFRFRTGLDAQSVGPPLQTEVVPLDQFLARVETEQIQLALERSRRNKTQAAKLLGLTRARLYRRMEALGIDDLE